LGAVLSLLYLQGNVIAVATVARVKRNKGCDRNMKSKLMKNSRAMKLGEWYSKDKEVMKKEN